MYDHSNLVKTSPNLVEQIRPHIWCDTLFWQKEKQSYKYCKSEKQTQFFSRKFWYEENITLQITTLSRKEVDMIEKKIHKFAIICNKETPTVREKRK